MRRVFGTSLKPLGHDNHHAGRRNRFASAVATTLFTIAIGGATSAQAASLVEFDLTGATGSQASNAATFVATGLTGIDLTRGSGLGTNTGADSMNANGWNDLNANDFFLFGFNVSGGNSASVNALNLGTRASGTGPGFVNVLYSVNGGAETLLTTITQSGTNSSYTALTFAPISVTGSFRVFLRAANATSANGGTIGSTGTLRITEYSPDNGTSFQPVTVGGTVTPTAANTPEPGTFALLVPIVGTVGMAVRRRRIQK